MKACSPGSLLYRRHLQPIGHPSVIKTMQIVTFSSSKFLMSMNDSSPFYCELFWSEKTTQFCTMVLQTPPATHTPCWLDSFLIVCGSFCHMFEPEAAKHFLCLLKWATRTAHPLTAGVFTMCSCCWNCVLNNINWKYSLKEGVLGFLLGHSLPVLLQVYFNTGWVVEQ